ncbi:MAG: flagellar biosynthesis anti-sigma factor FlgM [Chitinivibrionales bacterium]|nr:flagellar biosynthesis anti-sigma factor FlgM [Chitinivibrionales bacterium]
MDIQIIRNIYGSNLYDLKKNTSQPKLSAETDNTDQKEKVEISSESSQLSILRQIVDTMPDVRLEVVENIKTRIKMNDYPIQNYLDETLKKLISSNIVAPD